MNLADEIIGDVVEADNDEIQLQLSIFVRCTCRWEYFVRCYNAFDKRVHAVGKRGAMFANRTMDKPEMLEEHQLSVLIQSVEHFVAEIFLQRVSDFLNIVLSNCAGRFQRLEVIKQLGVLEQKFLKVMLR